MSQRPFTDLEDNIIRCIANGSIKLNVRETELQLKRMWSTIEARAEALGTPINRKKRRKFLDVGLDQSEEPLNSAAYSCTVGDDELLARLRLLHPDREKRYG